MNQSTKMKYEAKVEVYKHVPLIKLIEKLIKADKENISLKKQNTSLIKSKFKLIKELNDFETFKNNLNYDFEH